MDDAEWCLPSDQLPFSQNRQLLGRVWTVRFVEAIGKIGPSLATPLNA